MAIMVCDLPATGKYGLRDLTANHAAPTERIFKVSLPIGEGREGEIRVELSTRSIRLFINAKI
jgi:hypothetical protein